MLLDTRFWFYAADIFNLLLSWEV